MTVAKFPGWDAVERLDKEEAKLLFPAAVAQLDDIYSKYDWNPAYGGPPPSPPDVWLMDGADGLWIAWVGEHENDRVQFRKWDDSVQQWSAFQYWPQ